MLSKMFSHTEKTQEEKQKQRIEDFRVDAKLCVQKICDYMKKRESVDVYPNVKPGYLRSVFPSTAPVKPEPFKKILDDFFEHILRGTCHWNHPNFHAYFPAGNAFPNVYGDTLSTLFGGVGFSWTSQPTLTEVENAMLEWLWKALRLPDQFSFRKTDGEGGGCSHNTASDAIYTTILAARALYLENAVPEGEHPGKYLVRAQVYASTEAHHCVEKGARAALCSIRLLTPNENGSLTGEILEQAIMEDMKKGMVPIYCCATLGTPCICAYDDLDTIGPVCQKYNIWLNVDAAYAGNALILNNMDHLRTGLEYADSFVVNPYKLMLGAVDLSILYVKSVRNYIKGFLIDAIYLLSEFDTEEEREIKKYEIDYRHYGISLSRRMRCLKLWFLFRCYGLMGLRNYILEIRHAASRFELMLGADPRFEIMNNVTLGLVCFRQKVPKQYESFRNESNKITLEDKFTLNLLLRINKTRKMRLTPCTANGRLVIRMSMNYEFLNQSHIDSAVEMIQYNYVESLDKTLDDMFNRSENITAERLLRMTSAVVMPFSDFKEYLKDNIDLEAILGTPITFGPVVLFADMEVCRLFNLKIDG